MIHDSARDTPRVKGLRAAFAVRVTEELADILPRLKFLDESGVNLGLTRLYGRAAPGERVVEATPGISGPHYTVVATLGVDGVQAPLLFEGSMTAVAFDTYVEDVLAPTLQRGEILLMDNLSAHKSGQAQARLEARGVQVVFLPPYSPDLNPIEHCWGKVKQALRAAKARTWDALIAALRDALLSVAPSDVLAWFAHCGYETASII
jgi:transposase